VRNVGPSAASLGIPVLALAALASLVSCEVDRARPLHHVADGILVETRDSTFVRDVLSSGRPSVVYFHALGCIPCAFLGPHVVRLAARFAGRVTFWSLDRGWSAERVRRYGVPMLPTLVFYSGQNEVARQVGMPQGATDDSLASFVEAGMRALSFRQERSAGRD
jgi:thioredoxin-like negative regulator of GroEL